MFIKSTVLVENRLRGTERVAVAENVKSFSHSHSEMAIENTFKLYKWSKWKR